MQYIWTCIRSLLTFGQSTTWTAKTTCQKAANFLAKNLENMPDDALESLKARSDDGTPVIAIIAKYVTHDAQGRVLDFLNSEIGRRLLDEQTPVDADATGAATEAESSPKSIADCIFENLHDDDLKRRFSQICADIPLSASIASPTGSSNAPEDGASQVEIMTEGSDVSTSTDEPVAIPETDAAGILEDPIGVTEDTASADGVEITTDAAPEDMQVAPRPISGEEFLEKAEAITCYGCEDGSVRLVGESGEIIIPPDQNGVLDLSGCHRLYTLKLQEVSGVKNIILPGEVKIFIANKCKDLAEVTFLPNCNLQKLTIENCELFTKIDFSNCITLREINIWQTQIRAIDISGLAHLQEINLEGNSQLESIILPEYNQNRLSEINLKGCNKITDECRAAIDDFYKKVKTFRQVVGFFANERRNFIWQYCPNGLDDSGIELRMEEGVSIYKVTNWDDIKLEKRVNPGLPICLCNLEAQLNCCRATLAARSEMNDRLQQAEAEIPGITAEFDEALAAWKAVIEKEASGRMQELAGNIEKWMANGSMELPQRISMPAQEEETRLLDALSKLWQDSATADLLCENHPYVNENIRIRVEPPKSIGISLELIETYSGILRHGRRWAQKKHDANLEKCGSELDRRFPGMNYGSWEGIEGSRKLLDAFQFCNAASKSRNTLEILTKFFEGTNITADELCGIAAQFSMKSVEAIPRNLLIYMNFAYHVLRHGNAEKALAAYREAHV
jgi:hypothetical protein